MTSSLSPFPPPFCNNYQGGYVLHFEKENIVWIPPRVFHFLLIQKEKSVCSSVFFFVFFFKVWTFSTACLPTMTRGREMNAGSRHCTEHRHTQIIQYSPWCEVSVAPPPPGTLSKPPDPTSPYQAPPPKKTFSSYEVSSWTRTGYKPLHTTRPSTLYELTTRGFTKATGWCWISPGPS